MSPLHSVRRRWLAEGGGQWAWSGDNPAPARPSALASAGDSGLWSLTRFFAPDPFLRPPRVTNGLVTADWGKRRVATGFSFLHLAKWREHLARRRGDSAQWRAGWPNGTAIWPNGAGDSAKWRGDLAWCRELHSHGSESAEGTGRAAVAGDQPWGWPFGEDGWRDEMVREWGLGSTMRDRGRPSRRSMVESAGRPVQWIASCFLVLWKQ